MSFKVVYIKINFVKNNFKRLVNIFYYPIIMSIIKTILLNKIKSLKYINIINDLKTIKLKKTQTEFIEFGYNEKFSYSTLKLFLVLFKIKWLHYYKCHIYNKHRDKFLILTSDKNIIVSNSLDDLVLIDDKKIFGYLRIYSDKQKQAYINNLNYRNYINLSRFKSIDFNVTKFCKK